MLTADLRERLDEKAERLGLSRGAAVRDAVADYVNDGAALISRQVARGP
ncbi:MAG: ribbon-helix-helix protein, CopG family [Paracoccaceae bacterium]